LSIVASKPNRKRTISKDQLIELEQQLSIMAETIAKNSVSIKEQHHVSVIGCPSKLLEFGIDQVKEAVKNAEYIFTIADVTKLVDIWQMKHATTILDIFRTIFGDVDEQIMDIDYEDDYSEQVCNYEWVDIVNDQSFMELLNQSEWFVDSALEDDPDDNI
jgi:hypothetical protein